MLAIKDPVTMEEAVESLDEEECMMLIKKELKIIAKNGTWTKGALSPGKSVTPCTMMFKHRLNDQGNVSRFKARLVEK